MKYTDAQLLEKADKLKADYPKDKYWIIGVRSKEDESNLFDDKFYLFNGNTFILVTTGTTNPGLPVLVGGFTKYTTKGAAVLQADYWHKDIWAPGMHKGKVKALVQVNPCPVFRDNDKDTKSEEIGIKEVGLFGINFHPASHNPTNKVRTEINGWSAGCQVVNDDEKYLRIITLIGKQKRVSYLLLNEF